MGKAGTLNLYHIDIQGAGTPLVQSLTSHLCNVAAAHQRSPTALLRIVSRHAGASLDDIAGQLAGIDGSVMNGYGSVQLRALTALARASNRVDLDQMCLGHLGRSFASKGGRAVKVNRHWCPTCYRTMRQKSIPAYDLLLWQVTDLMVCPSCGDDLQDKCPSCSEPQKTLPSSCVLDVCGSCGTWLAETPESSRSNTLAGSGYQKWLSFELQELLTSRENLAPLLTGFEASRFIAELTQVRKVSLADLSARAGIPFHTMRQWRSGRNQPTLAFWLRACANLGVSPARTLLDPVLAAHQIPFPFDGPSVYTRSREAPAKRHDGKAIQQAIHAQMALKKPTVRGVLDLAKQINVPVQMMYFHDNDGCKALTAKLRAIQGKKRSKRRETLQRSAQRILSRMDSEKLPLIRKTFISRMVANTKCNPRVAKKLFPSALDKYLDQRSEI